MRISVADRLRSGGKNGMEGVAMINTVLEIE